MTGNDGGYASAFALATSRARALTPEQWARGVFEQGPATLRSFVDLGWRALLGLRLGPRDSSDHVAGWTIADVDERPDTVTLTAESRLLRARNIVAVGDGVVEWVTTVQFQQPLGRAVWAAAVPVHSFTIPYLLTRTARTVEERPSPS